MDLRQTYSAIYTEVSEYLGTGDIPVDRDLRKAQEIVWKGYRRFLRARNPENGKRHYWSFLEKTSSLVLRQGQWQYQLPADFDKIKTKFNFSQNSNFTAMHSVSREAILQNRALSVTNTYPTKFCVVPTYTKETGKLNELWVYGDPNQNYVLSYSYYFIPPKLENDEEYFAGGDIFDECILACCLAEAEIKHTRAKGDMYGCAMESLAAAVLADQRTKPDGLGLNGDPGIHRVSVERPLPAIPEDEVYN